jgi:hypothetical protein
MSETLWHICTLACIVAWIFRGDEMVIQEGSHLTNNLSPEEIINYSIGISKSNQHNRNYREHLVIKIWGKIR